MSTPEQIKKTVDEEPGLGTDLTLTKEMIPTVAGYLAAKGSGLETSWPKDHEVESYENYMTVRVSLYGNH